MWFIIEPSIIAVTTPSSKQPSNEPHGTLNHDVITQNYDVITQNYDVIAQNYDVIRGKIIYQVLWCCVFHVCVLLPWLCRW